ncbi:FkbM family methyltransferase [Roseovarius sp. C7]|uniref:FkbM family methyltransferase n=1 Tax=Roseovarius sp. C7 TaxID=3398643 RepID=UPI0039F55F6F
MSASDQIVTLPAPEATDASYFDLEAVMADLGAGRAVRFPPFEMVYWPDGGLQFALNMARDPIQKALRAGRFFEEDELDLMSRNVKSGAHVIDIGSNIGNHAIYFATRMQAARVVLVEPNPLALAPLVANVLLNKLGHVIDMGALGVGLSDRSEGGFGMKRHDRNLGATKMRPGKGQIEVHAGDDLFADEAPDLIKIDVEGMEIKVLSGLKKTIARHRPVILVEVDEENAGAFESWRAEQGYVIERSLRHSAKNCNHLLIPEARA